MNSHLLAHIKSTAAARNIGAYKNSIKCATENELRKPANCSREYISYELSLRVQKAGDRRKRDDIIRAKKYFDETLCIAMSSRCANALERYDLTGEITDYKRITGMHRKLKNLRSAK